MVLSSWIRTFAILCIVAGAAALGPFGNAGHPVSATTIFTVNSALDLGDLAPGDGSCKTSAGNCTLRAAIQEGNALAGSDIVEFALGGPNPSIAPLSELPQITGDLDIRGDTGGAIRVVLTGASAGPGSNGFRACAGLVQIRDMVINGFGRNGISAECSGMTLLDDNYIGTDAGGVFDSGNTGSGVAIFSTGTTVVSYSIISGNDLHGIDIAPPGADPGSVISIYGNLIGLQTGAAADVGNTFNGINALGTWNQDLFILGNNISGNNGIGINVGINIDGAELVGNLVGMTWAGTPLPNGTGGPSDFGINIAGDNTIVDGTQLSWGPNVIASQSGGQIQTFTSASGTVIKGNLIGTDLAGNVALGGGVGIHLNSAGTTVGGSIASERNVISGNGNGGITLGTSATGNTMQGNLIGVGADLVTPLGNGTGGLSGGAGIAFFGAKDNTVVSNTIAFGKSDGVRSNIAGSTGNELTLNSIHDNGGLGINWIGLIGADPNDAGDADAGPNNLQNYPVIASAKTNGVFTVIDWSLNSTPATGFQIEFYSSSSCDPSGFGEGETWLAAIEPPATDGAGNLGPATTLAAGTAVGNFITATAAGVLSNDTSEFSACVAVTSCGLDFDCDGFVDVAPTVHQGPANTNASVDNCIGSFNPGQQNSSDGDFIDLSPPKAYDDVTWPNSDAMGDFCTGETDSDNDGIDDGNEAFGIGCVPTDPSSRDTDGDLFLDGAECALGTDPADVNSKPLTTACGAATDVDGDQYIEQFEICFYNTKPSVADTDGDGCPDGKEISSVNGDRKANSIDLSQVSQAFTPGYTLPASAVNAVFDVNKDAKISSIDLSLIAQNFGDC